MSQSGLGAYDEGLLNYLKSALNFPNIVNAAESKAFDTSADKNSHKVEIQLPMISFWRIANPLTYEGGGNFAMRQRGRRMSADKEGLTAVAWRSLPVTLSYQLTIWSDRRSEVDDIYRELMMYLLTDNPHITIQLEGMETPEEFYIHVTDTDTSTDVDSFSDKGRLYTQNIMIDIPAAQLIFSRNFTIAKDIQIRSVVLDNSDIL